MSEFKDKLISGWVEVDSKTKSYLMGYRGLKTQHEHVFKDAVEHGHGFAMVSIEGVEQVSIAHVINPFPCEELGDDFPIENRISPLCKSKDV
ncbi:hypothetical protein [Acinetobacter baumannii]|uniref:hypothetical protein n=1 Tax=Acinetobacter baumannii TaxID=470 RepID=UPI001F3233A5|nr:hypothetical protein [Acinetobacter baumannii]MDO7394664.1 hypothetical protein [Acinetobacter baumannii]